MITRDDYFGAHAEKPEPAVEANAADLLRRVNALLAEIGMKTYSVSGWRPPKYNAELRRLWIATKGAQGANTAVNSNHMTGNADDVFDNADQQIALLLLADWQANGKNSILARHGLYMEHPSKTIGKRTNWCHLQRVPPRSGEHVFHPF